jgi:hypothetical protein
VRSQVSNKLEVQQKGQLRGHLRSGVVEIQQKSEESGIEQARGATKGTAERALTRWSCRKFSRKERSQVSNKPKVQQEGQLSGHLQTKVVESLVEK